ncbi:MAG: hypothetical protein ACE14P_03490 [Methanotrichaceae archaeon]
MLFVFAGLISGIASGTMWLYTDPTFFSGIQSGTPATSFGYQSTSIGTFTSLHLTPFEIINSPIFPMLGHGFSLNATPASGQAQGGSAVVSLGSTGKLDTTPPQMTFNGGTENNMKYAQTKSSIRVGQSGSWSNLNSPWLI